MANRTKSKRKPAVRTAPGGRKREVAARKARPADWIAGARPRTLPLAVAPVALGAGAATQAGWTFGHWVPAVLCLAVAVLLQVGVNFANDYSDGIRGTDRFRVGPERLTASGAAKPATVLRVALVSFALAAAAGLGIVLITDLWWLLAVGAIAIVAAWFYTGGKRPYGYAGLGEIVVFIFFGIVATMGTTLVLSVGHLVNSESVFGAVALGCIASATLLVNNLRDIDQDRAAGKRTLSVLIGAKASRWLYGALMLLPYVLLVWISVFYMSASLVFMTLLIAGPAIVITATAKTAKELVLALSLTGLTALTYGVGLGAAFAF